MGVGVGTAGRRGPASHLPNALCCPLPNSCCPLPSLPAAWPQNFPGNVSLMVNYTLTDADELIVGAARPAFLSQNGTPTGVGCGTGVEHGAVQAQRTCCGGVDPPQTGRCGTKRDQLHSRSPPPPSWPPAARIPWQAEQPPPRAPAPPSPLLPRPQTSPLSQTPPRRSTCSAIPTSTWAG